MPLHEASFGGPGEKLVDQTLGATTASFDLTAITQARTSLVLFMLLRGTQAAAGVLAGMTVNGSSAAIYDRQSADANAGASPPGETFGATSWSMIAVPGASASASHFGSVYVLFPFYSETGAFKTMHAKAAHSTGTTTGLFTLYDAVGLWRSTAAITQITITPSAGSWAAGSRCVLYGI